MPQNLLGKRLRKAGIKASIVIPAFNEEKGIGETLSEINSLSKSKDFEVIVVDDASRDDTRGIASSFGARVLRHKENKGYGAALKTGIDAAKNSTIIFLDADNTYPVKEIPRLLKIYLSSKADMVVGSRLSGKDSKMPFLRFFGNKILVSFASFLLGKKVSDLSSGMRVVEKKTVQGFYPLSDDLDFALKLSMKAFSENRKVVEVPITYNERKGNSKLSARKHGMQFFKTITFVVRDHNPLKLFVPISIAFFVLGLLNLLQLAVRRYYFAEVSIEISNGLIISGMLILFAFQVLFFGVLADMIADMKKQ